MSASLVGSEMCIRDSPKEWQSTIDWKRLQRRSKSGPESSNRGRVCSNLIPASAFSWSSATLTLGSWGGEAASA
eukprot:14727267-Alexandrium_andersonii.AAC.1